jgi:hypothetical protein
MIRAWVNKFHPLDDNAIQHIISSMQTFTLLDTKDLSIYHDKLENYNLQLSWVGQNMSPSFLVHLAQTQLGKSRYKNDIEALQMSHTTSGTSFKTLADLCDGLERLDKLKGLLYGGAAPIQKPTPSKTPQNKKQNTVGFVAAVEDTITDPTKDFEFHKEPWVGTINLPEHFVKQLCQMFKCVQCRSNDHTLPSCPLMKNWSIKKKPRSNTISDKDKTSKDSAIGGANSVLAPQIIGDDSTNQIPPDSLEEDTKEFIVDYDGPVEFKLLNHFS